MIEDFEFSDAKQVRKTLLITSFAGICFKILVKNSTGEISFIGFKIPVENASIIPTLAACLIIYEIIALIIRYSDENLRELYRQKQNYIETPLKNSNIIRTLTQIEAENLYPINAIKVKIVKHGIKFIDILFPILLGVAALIFIFFF